MTDQREEESGQMPEEKSGQKMDGQDHEGR